MNHTTLNSSALNTFKVFQSSVDFGAHLKPFGLKKKKKTGVQKQYRLDLSI